jgi:PAS domain S-box-containing protein
MPLENAPNPSEAHRLDTLRKYEILDTLPEQIFDDLAKLAADICGAPMAVISLVEEDRQWFKAKVGWAVQETSREVSFCAHALHQEELFVVPDATQDSRFAKNAMVTGEPQIRFYAGAPLIAPSGEGLGALCVIDRVPRTLSPEQQEALHILGRQVMAQLELRRQKRELRASEERLEASERRFRGIFDSMFHFSGLLAPDGTLLEANQTALDLIQKPLAEVLGKHFAETPWWAHSADEQRKLRDGIEQAALGETVRFETSHPGADGRVHHIDFSLKPMFDAAGRVAHLVSEGRDITERKLAEEKVAWLATFPVGNPNPVVEIDLTGNIIHYVNEAANRLLPDLRALGLQHPYLTGLEEVKATLLGGETDAVRRELLLGGASYAQVIIHVPEAQSFRIYGSDITLRKQTEERLRLSEERFRLIVESAKDYALFMLDPEGRISNWNSGAEHIKGYAAGEIIGQHFSIFYPPEALAERKPERELAEALACGEARDEGWRLRKDGSRFYANVTITAIRDGKGKLLGFGKVVRDITEPRKAQLELQESRTRYRSLFQNMLDGYCYCSVVRTEGRVTDFIFLEVNDAFEPLTGLSKVEGKRASEVIPGVQQTNPEIFKIYERVTSTGQPEKYETYFPALGIWFSVGVYSPDEDHFVAVFDNITERKRSTAAIEDVTTRLQLATKASGIGVWDLDVRTHALVWDEQMYSLYGIPPGTASYENWAQTLLPEDLVRETAARKETIRQMGRTEQQFRIRRRSDGALRVIDAAYMVVTGASGEPERVVGVNRDVAELEAARANLAASEELLRQFVKYIPAAIAMLDTELRYVLASDRWLKDYHLEGSEIVGRSHYEVFPDIPLRWKKIHQRVLQGAVESCDEDPFYRVNGVTEWLQWEARPWRKPGGEVGGIVFCTRVITERKEAEARMRESEERFRGAFENAPIGMALVSLRGRWIRVNHAICEMFGRTEEELLACTFQDITHPEDLEPDLDKVRALVAGEIDHYQIEKRYFHKSGRIVWALLAVTLVRNADDQPVHFISQIEDITARHEAGEQMRRSLEEKEVLLREIHHRVKNNMQVITSLLQLQSSYLRDPEDAAIFKECQARIHAMGLVHDRLYRSGNLATIDFSEHLRELTALLIRGQSTAAAGIRLVAESEPVEVNLDIAIPLGLIVAELITNAYKHAFRDRREGTISVRLFHSDPGKLTLIVEDDGVGMPADFEPEKTRSLGLRLIRALSKQLRAEPAIASSDKGNRVALTFPI